MEDLHTTMQFGTNVVAFGRHEGKPIVGIGEAPFPYAKLPPIDPKYKAAFEAQKKAREAQK